MAKSTGHNNTPILNPRIPLCQQKFAQNEMADLVELLHGAANLNTDTGGCLSGLEAIGVGPEGAGATEEALGV